ncbi:MAG: ABC transporter substrate-binding protein [Bacillota bacterium]
MKRMKTPHLFLLLCIVLSMVFLVGGCGDKPDGPKPTSAVYKDVLGREVEIAGIPEKVVSLTPAVTEVLFALGLDDQIVGVTEYCNYPEAALAKPKMGDFSNPNVELVLESDADLVFVAAGVQMDLIERFEELGVKVLCLDAETINQVIANINLVGEIMGVSEKAAEITADMQNRTDYIVKKVEGREKPLVFFEVWDDPLMTAGPGTFIYNLIELAGGINTAYDVNTRYPQFSFEVLLERDPDVYFANDFHKQSDIMARPGYTQLKAVKTGRVHTIDDDLVTLPGPRVVLGLEEMARLIHPEVFN